MSPKIEFPHSESLSHWHYMDTYRKENIPLISICIPTFNRSGHLHNLLRSLEPIKQALTTDLEICVSNNNSSDDTEQVLEAWRQTLDLKIINQSSNIGATLNFIAATTQATGLWIQLMGDDDAFDAIGFISLTESLRTFDENTWILAGITNKNADENLLGNLSNERYTCKKFRAVLVRTGLYRYGFVGMHIFPSSLLPTYHKLSLASMQGWPHLALFMRHVSGGGSIVVYKRVVAEQAAGSPALFWGAQDWARVSMGKVGLISALKAERRSLCVFYDMIILRELYSMQNIKSMILWKTLEGTDFNRSALCEQLCHYRVLGAGAPFALPHLLFLMCIRAIPSRAVQFVLRMLGHNGIVTNYLDKKTSMAKFNAVNRSL